MPTGLPEPLVHYLRLRLVPGRRDAPLQDAAGRREHLRHAGCSSRPARPAAQPRGGAAARPAAPCTRGAAYRHSRVTRILAPPHLPAAALRPAPSGFPLSRRVRPPRRPGFPTPGPGPPACASPSLPALPSLTPAPFPPLPALSPHLGVPNPTPVAAFRWAPALRGSHVVAPKPRREREAPPTRGDVGAARGVRETQRSLWGLSSALGELRLRNTSGWLGRGWGVVSRSHLGIFLRTRPASP